MNINKICVLGGTGFIGSALCNRLSALGYSIRVLTRNRESNKHRLILLPNVELIEANIFDVEHLNVCFQGCDAVINLVGILNEKGFKGEGFHKAHVELVENIVRACEAHNVKRVLHMSALNADSVNGPSFYLKTKSLAEDYLFQQTNIAVTCYRPSVIFGKHDSFFNRFANLLKPLPYFFPLACPYSRFAPIYVEDVVEFVSRTISDANSFQKSYELVGPEEFTLIELVRYTAKCLGIKRTIIPLNDFFSRLQAKVFDFIPGKPFSTDNYLSCKRDSTSNNNALSMYSITPTPITSIVPYYLADESTQTQYDQYRRFS